MKILIGGDIVAQKENEESFANGNAMDLLGSEIIEKLTESDINIYNLEAPITDANIPIDKQGPHIRQIKGVINGIKALCPTIVTIANNHIMDYGWKGLEDTIKALELKEIMHIGAGENLAAAKEHASCIIKKDGIKLGIYACAQHEFSIARTDFPGVNPYDPLVSFDEIYKLKQCCDFLIVLYHGGQENYPFPSPELQKIFRKMSEKGADVVVAQHTHCIGCYEEYQRSLLVYGQGNFIFNSSDDEISKTSLLIALEIEKKGEKVVFQKSFVPLRALEEGKIRIAYGDDAEMILDKFEKRSINIKKDGYIEKQYRDNANTNFHYLLRYADGKSNSFIVRVIDKLTHGNFTRRYYKKRDYLALYNVMKCEAHRELLEMGIEEKLGYNGRKE